MFIVTIIQAVKGLELRKLRNRAVAEDGIYRVSL